MVVAAVAAFVIAPVAVEAQSLDYAQAAQLYRDVISGRRKIETLSRDELNAVIAIQRSLRRSASGKPECRDAMDRAESAAQDVASYGRRLISCVQGDYRDDCSSEFRRLRSAHGDYESAVSEVQSYCD
jgi:hypothetical protein